MKGHIKCVPESIHSGRYWAPMAVAFSRTSFIVDKFVGLSRGKETRENESSNSVVTIKNLI